MRLCRFQHRGRAQAGLYDDKFVVPLETAAEAYSTATRDKQRLEGDDLLQFLPSDGKQFAVAKKIADWTARNDGGVPAAAKLAHDAIELLVPVPRPNKLLRLAGNYNEHSTEGGGKGTERQETFPYVFTKPPSTTLI